MCLFPEYVGTDTKFQQKFLTLRIPFNTDFQTNAWSQCILKLQKEQHGPVQSISLQKTCYGKLTEFPFYRLKCIRVETWHAHFPDTSTKISNLSIAYMHLRPHNKEPIILQDVPIKRF